MLVRSRYHGERTGRWSAWMMSLPAIVTHTMFAWLPIGLAFVVATQKYYVAAPPESVGLDNFAAVFNDPMTKTAFMNTFIYAGLSLLMTFLPPIVVSVMLMELSPRAIRILMLLWFLPIANTAGIVIWQYFYNQQYGLFNYVLESLYDTFHVGSGSIHQLTSLTEAFGALGGGAAASWGLVERVLAAIGSSVGNLHLWPIGPQGWLDDKSLAMLCLVLPGFIMFGPSLIYISVLKSIPDDFYEAAELDGAGFWRKLWHITLPRLRPVMAMMLIFQLIWSLQVFDLPFIMTGGGPGDATRTVALYIYDIAFRNLDFGKGTALAVVFFFVIMVLVILQRTFFKEDLDT